MTNEKPIGVIATICKVMADVGAITKDRKNERQNYSFRGIDDVYNELHGIMVKHKLFTTTEVLEQVREERRSKGGGLLIYSILKIKFTFYAADGTNVESIVIGEGMDNGDKASNKAMAVAHKYALLQMFCVPTADSKDPEDSSPELQGSADNMNQDQQLGTPPAAAPQAPQYDTGGF